MKGTQHYMDLAEKSLERADTANEQGLVVAHQVRALICALLAIAEAIDDVQRRIDDLKGH